MQEHTSNVRRLPNRVVIRMDHDIYAARADVLLTRDGREFAGKPRSKVRSSEFRTPRTLDFEPSTVMRVVPLALDAPRSASVQRIFANNVCFQLYIQILAQYNSEVLHACCREG